MVWKVYHYDKGQKLEKNFLWNLKLNWLNFRILLLDYTKGISILSIKLAILTKLQSFFFVIAYNYTINFEGEKQVAMKTTGYKQLRVTVMLCITTNVNKSPPHIILNRKTGQKKCLQRCNSSGPKKCTDDIRVNPFVTDVDASSTLRKLLWGRMSTMHLSHFCGHILVSVVIF
jgi:hypothetical protein